MMKSICFVALIMVAMSAAAQQPQSPAISIRVSAADLDVTSAQGTRALDRRLKAAVRRVCGDLDARDPYRQSAYRQCLTIARQSAQAGRAALVAHASDQAPRINISR